MFVGFYIYHCILFIFSLSVLNVTVPFTKSTDSFVSGSSIPPVSSTAFCSSTRHHLTRGVCSDEEFSGQSFFLLLSNYLVLISEENWPLFGLVAVISQLTDCNFNFVLLSFLQSFNNCFKNLVAEDIYLMESIVIFSIFKARALYFDVLIA